MLKQIFLQKSDAHKYLINWSKGVYFFVSSVPDNPVLLKKFAQISFKNSQG